jgi:hypothetical protein
MYYCVPLKIKNSSLFMTFILLFKFIPRKYISKYINK